MSSEAMKKRAPALRPRVYRSPASLSETPPPARPEIRDSYTRYQQWALATMISGEEFAHQRRHAGQLAYQPTISLLTPVFETPLDILDQTIASVRQQTYPFWELCLVNDGSLSPGVAEALDAAAAGDRRITVRHRAVNGGIVASSNDAFALASGDYVALLDHDDLIAPDALYAVARLLNEHPEADMVYSDEDKLSPDGRRFFPLFKPDWSPEFLEAAMYTCHLGVYRRSLVAEVGAFRAGTDGSQDFDLVLRIMERTNRIFHVPQVLYHWRQAPQSVALDPTNKMYAFTAAHAALEAYIERNDIAGVVMVEGPYGPYRIRYDIIGRPLVSIIVAPTATIADADDRAGSVIDCVERLVRGTAYGHYEILALDPGDLSVEERAAIARAGHGMARLVEIDGATSRWSRLNAAAAQARGEHLLFYDDDLEPRSEVWLTELLSLSQREGIGAVGAKLYRSTGEIEQAGVVLPQGVPQRIGAGYPAWVDGYFGQLHTMRNYSAVGGSCLITQRRLFEEIGGFLDAFVSDYDAFDYCLRLRELGQRIIFTPYAELRRRRERPAHEAARSEEASLFREIWKHRMPLDPYYNQNLAQDRADFHWLEGIWA